jgi:WD40 repeat protein
LATAGDDAVIRIWDISGIESTQLAGHRGAAVGVAVRPDGSQIASIASDNSLGFWTVQPDLKVGQPFLVALPFVPTAIAYSRDGRYLATAGSDGKVQIRDSFTGRVVQTINEPEITVRGMAFSPDGGSLATVGMVGSVIVWHWKEPRIAQELRGHEGTVLAIAYSPDGRCLATAGGDRIVRLWDSATGRLKHSLPRHTDFVNCLAFSPDGRFLASAGDDPAILLWDLSEWSLAPTPMNGRHSAAVLGLAFSPGRRRPRVASASADGTVKLWDTATFLETLTLSEHTDQVTAVAFGPDGRFLVSASRDGMLRLWNATE